MEGLGVIPQHVLGKDVNPALVYDQGSDGCIVAFTLALVFVGIHVVRHILLGKCLGNGIICQYLIHPVQPLDCACLVNPSRPPGSQYDPHHQQAAFQLHCPGVKLPSQPAAETS